MSSSLDKTLAGILYQLHQKHCCDSCINVLLSILVSLSYQKKKITENWTQSDRRARFFGFRVNRKHLFNSCEIKIVSAALVNSLTNARYVCYKMTVHIRDIQIDVRGARRFFFFVNEVFPIFFRTYVFCVGNFLKITIEIFSLSFCNSG